MSEMGDPVKEHPFEPQDVWFTHCKVCDQLEDAPEHQPDPTDTDAEPAHIPDGEDGVDDNCTRCGKPDRVLLCRTCRRNDEPTEPDDPNSISDGMQRWRERQWPEPDDFEGLLDAWEYEAWQPGDQIVGGLDARREECEPARQRLRQAWEQEQRKRARWLEACHVLTEERDSRYSEPEVREMLDRAFDNGAEWGQHGNFPLGAGGCLQREQTNDRIIAEHKEKKPNG